MCIVDIFVSVRCVLILSDLAVERGFTVPNGQISEYLDPTERLNNYDSSHDVLIDISNTCALSLYLYLSVVFRYYLICPLKGVLRCPADKSVNI